MLEYRSAIGLSQSRGKIEDETKFELGFVWLLCTSIYLLQDIWKFILSKFSVILVYMYCPELIGFMQTIPFVIFTGKLVLNQGKCLRWYSFKKWFIIFIQKMIKCCKFTFFNLNFCLYPVPFPFFFFFFYSSFCFFPFFFSL